MIDRFLYAFFGFFDDIATKLNEITTFDVGEKNKKKEKLRNANIVIVNVIVKKNYTHIIGITIFVFVRNVNVRRSKRRN